ncbi:hypothetical protein ABTD15_19410, partial [Acinetobacter baumannii]
KLGEFERPASDLGDGAQGGVRRIHENAAPAAMPGYAPPRLAAKPCLVLRPFAMHGVSSDQAHLVQGFSLHLAASLVRFREWSVVDRPPP